MRLIFINMKHHFLLPFLTAGGIFVLTALMFNLSALSAGEAARPIELFLCFTGVMLLTPIFYPEQNHDLRDVISSKRTSYLAVCTLRLAYSVAVLVLFVIFFVCIMKENESMVTGRHIVCGIATALFLGAVGFFVAGISDNTTLGYMAAMLYYLANYGLKNKLGKFYLFHMSAGNYEEKWWLFFGASLLFLITLAVLWLRRRSRGY